MIPNDVQVINKVEGKVSQIKQRIVQARITVNDK
jgi:hypothetical protein